MWSARNLKMSLVIAGMSVLTGCSSTSEVRLTGLTSLTRPPLSVAVSSIEIVKAEEAESSAQEGRVDSLMDPTPAVIVEQWAQDRFQAKGSAYRAVVTIEEASIREQSVPAKIGFFESPLIKYTGTFALKFEIFAPDGSSRGHVNAVTSTSRVVSESLTVAAREKVWLCLTETALNQLDDVLEAKIREYLPQYL